MNNPDQAWLVANDILRTISKNIIWFYRNRTSNSIGLKFYFFISIWIGVHNMGVSGRTLDDMDAGIPYGIFPILISSEMKT